MAAPDPGTDGMPETVRTVCSYCGVGCGMVLSIGTGPDGRRTVLKASGDREHPANSGRLCTKGATTAEMLSAPGRLTTALVRPGRGDEPVPAPLDAAVAETARRLRAVIDEHGPDAVALYVSGQMSLEAQYLANKLAKGFIRTNQIESDSRLCMASAGTGYKLSLGADGPPGSYQDLDRADVSARLTGNRLLSLPGAGKEVRRFTFDTRDSERPLIHEAGDALAVRPRNSPELVAEWLAVTGLDADTAVRVDGTGEMSLGDAFLRHLDITRLGPGLLRFVADRARDPRELRTLLRPDNKGELAKWSWGRQAVDVVTEYGVRADAQTWADVLGRLQPRLYSISSSPLTDPHLVSLTVSVVRYENLRGRARQGVCSPFLADAAPGTPVPVHVQRSPHFRPPADPATPMVMVGPGTGVAPFLGFLQERRARGHRAPNWLFFGEQHRATDFYYEEELTALRDGGTLTRLDTAFSRDQRAKVYVQDRMREHGPLLWSWLQDGAHFYVCGDASRMAKDVDRALRDIAMTHGGLTEDDAAAYVKQLTGDKRYVRDVY
ncbi:molybdopterin-dependent oxidoreductase [Streptomyces sp. NPDC004542]|uniref:molybdopterin-dependent oxidoreductase n=1 Tax=Streptomyces sp. NPDC004542 TaxID=3154281 RepID=UPI0033AF3C61